MLFAEITASFWDYGGQVLRTFTMGEPTPLYAELHVVADAAYDAITGVLRDGTTRRGDRGCRSHRGRGIHHHRRSGVRVRRRLPATGPRIGQPPGRPGADEPFRAGMTVVVQPNVTTPDGKAGVQTGELVLITATGVESLHRMPRGLTVLER